MKSIEPRIQIDNQMPSNYYRFHVKDTRNTEISKYDIKPRSLFTTKEVAKAQWKEREANRRKHLQTMRLRRESRIHKSSELNSNITNNAVKKWGKIMNNCSKDEMQMPRKYIRKKKKQLLSVTSHQGNSNKVYKETSPKIGVLVIWKSYKIINSGEDEGKCYPKPLLVKT